MAVDTIDAACALLTTYALADDPALRADAHAAGLTEASFAALVQQHRDEKLMAAGGHEENISNTAAAGRGVSSAIAAVGR